MYSGLTQAAMAQKLYMSESKYCRKENGTMAIKRNEAIKMAKLLNINERIVLKYWTADRIYNLMKLDRDIMYESLQMVESHFEDYETCIDMPLNRYSYSNLEKMMQHRKKKI